MNRNNPDDGQPKEGKKDFPGYPIYPPSEDIYSNADKEPEINPDSIAEGETQVRPTPKTENGNDLDVPGAELDDVNEEIGKEDEENNYYSLGGDDHNDLEEDQATGLD